MTRNRAVGVVVHGDKLLVMYRKNDSGEYYTFPGGGVERGETTEQAVVRELDEETSIKVKIGRLLYELHHDNGDVHYYFMCEYVSGEPAIREGTNEYEDNVKGNDIHDPRWIDPFEVSRSIPLYPPEITSRLQTDLKNGFGGAPVVLYALAAG